MAVEPDFAAIERMLVEGRGTGRFCHGDTPTVAECCLVPQIVNAERFFRGHLKIDADPHLRYVFEHGAAKFPYFSDGAVERMKQATSELDVDALWRERRR